MRDNPRLRCLLPCLLLCAVMACLVVRGADAEVEALIAARAAARARKDWAAADAARDKLKALGVVIKDTPEGTVWRRE